jgi:N-methylhydantoinase A
MLNIGVDTGGTFTDFVVFDEETSSVRVNKVPSTPADPTQAFMNGLRRLGIDLGTVRRIVHGTTIATNTVLERKGARVGLLVTEGHKDVVEYGQLRRYGEPGDGLWDIRWQRPEPYVARHLRFEIPERMLFTGKALKALRDEDVLSAIRALKTQQVESVAVTFLHSYANADHEKRAGQLVREHLPGISVSLSAETVPEFLEYERWSTTVLNAYIAPRLQEYLRKLSRTLSAAGFRGELFYMTSSGSILTATSAPDYPIRFLLSGPAAGVMAGVFIGQMTGFRNVITYDMGGTSTDICLIKDLKPIVTHERSFGGALVKTPQMDITTIGAGGGSVAWIGSEGGLRVGPESAGAVPGPACYGHGGRDVTVSDANLLLGRFGTGGLIGGAMALDSALAERAMSGLAGQAGLKDLPRLAEGVVKVCVTNMAGAVKTISTSKGYDPRDFVLVPIGGAGPMHAIPIADELGMNRILVPTNPGNACAFGLLTTDLQHNYARTYVTDIRDADLSRIRSLWKEMEEEGRRTFIKEGMQPDRIRVSYSADMRYLGQSFQLEVPLAIDCTVEQMRDAFGAVYHATYGYERKGMSVELVYLRVIATGTVDKPALRPHDGAPRPVSEAIKTTRPVYFDGAFVECPIYDRALLSPGSGLSGPAVVEEYGTCTVVFPGWNATVDRFGNLVLERERG